MSPVKELQTPRAEVVPDATGPRVLVAPVTVSPTKPLTPTHLKYLLSLDMLYRGTATFAEPTFLYHHSTFTGSQQVAGFWDYLERCHPELAYDEVSEERIGELYVAYHQAGPAPYDSFEPMVQRAESGWMHPASARLLDLWEDHYRLLGMFDPGLGRTGPELATAEEIIDLLCRRNLCIDGRDLGAPVYLDTTAEGLPLRLVLGPQGQSNYLLYLLRELVPLLPSHDLVLLAHDTELRHDYQTIAHVLTALGAQVERFEVPRVPVDGVTQSTRMGGWQGQTLAAFAPALQAEFGTAAFRPGARLYLVAGLGRTARESFSVRLLKRWVRRAQRLLAQHDGDAVDPGGGPAAGRYLASRAGQRGYADPYQLATSLLSRDRQVPVDRLLRVVLE